MSGSIYTYEELGQLDIDEHTPSGYEEEDYDE